MNKKFLGLAFVLALFFSSATGFLPGNSAAWTFNGGIPVPVLLPVIAIGSDGNINPETTFISRTGNTCTLTDNIEEHPIAIECSNIIFDGAGYNLTISTGDNVGLELNNVSNVTVKNISVFSSNIYTINLNYCFNCVIAGVRTNDYLTISGDFNTVTKSIIRLGILKGSNNLVCRNTIELLHIYGYYEFNSHSNILYENNFLSNTSTKQIDDISYIIDSPNLLDNGSIGNYQSDYKTKYPNASEINNTGLWDTPYVIDSNNKDNYPLMYPFDIEKDTIAFPTSSPELKPTESFQTILMIATVASLVVVVVGLLVYSKKHKQTK